MHEPHKGVKMSLTNVLRNEDVNQRKRNALTLK